jgi:outer membrane protein
MFTFISFKISEFSLMKIFNRKAVFFSFFAALLFFNSGGAFAQEPQIAKITAPKDTTAAQTNIAVVEESADAKENVKAVNSNSILKRVGVQTAQTVPLSLNEAIRKALENNNSIEIARNDVRFQETQLRSLLGNYDPVISVTPTFRRNSTTGSTATKDFIVNSDFSGLVRPGGGNYSVFFNNSRTENRFAQAQISSGSNIAGSSTSAIYSSNLGIQYNQPLLRNFGVDNTRRLIKIQRKVLQQSDADFRRQTIEIISQVQRAYWDLVFALRDQQNRLANLNLSRENLRQVEARIEAGAAAPLARAEVATELANREGEVLLAAQQVSNTENTLKTLVLKDPAAAEWTYSFVPTDAPVFTSDPVALDDAMKDAIENRPELRRLRLQKDINAIDIDYFRNQTKPRVDLNTTFSLGGLSQSGATIAEGATIPQFTGNDDILRRNLNVLLGNAGLPTIDNINIPVTPPPAFLTGGYNQALRNILRSDAPNYSVGLTIQFPLRNRTAEASLAGARVQQQQLDAQTRSQEQTVVAEVRNSVQAVETARERVLTARRAVQNAEIQLEGERKLYEVGRSTQFLLFQRENALTNARNAEIRAETDYNKALADLQRATSTTFRVNNIEVDSPMNDQD